MKLNLNKKVLEWFNCKIMSIWPVTFQDGHHNTIVIS